MNKGLATEEVRKEDRWLWSTDTEREEVAKYH